VLFIVVISVMFKLCDALLSGAGALNKACLRLLGDFGGNVAHGAIVGAFIAALFGAALWPTLGLDLSEVLPTVLLLGAMIGALGRAIARARLLSSKTGGLVLFSGSAGCAPLLWLPQPEGWESVRWASVWLGGSLGLILLMLLMLRSPKHTRVHMWALPILHLFSIFMSCSGVLILALFLCIVCGQIGNVLLPRLGLHGGEWLGAYLGGVFTWGMYWYYYPLPEGHLTAEQWQTYNENRAATLLEQKPWNGTLLQLGMIAACSLWFLLTDVPDGLELRHIEVGPECKVVGFSPDGRFGASAGPSGAIRLWNLEAGDVERYLEGPAEIVTNLAFAADGSRLLAGSKDGNVRLWNTRTGGELHRFRQEGAAQVAVSSDGQLMAVADSKDNAIKIWNVKTGEEVHCFTGHTGAVTSVAFSRDGHRVLSGSRDGTMRLWDVAREGEGRVFRRPLGWWVSCVAFTPDGRRAIAGYHDYSVRLWDLETRQELRCFQGHRDTVTSLAVSPDGHSFLSGSEDRTMRLWDLESGVQRCVFRGHRDGVKSVGFSAGDGRAVSWSADGTMRVWEPKE
jgi:hypothetical protein